MKKSILSPIIILLAFVCALPSWGRDFGYTYEGKTIKYTVIDENAKTVRTKEGYWNVNDYPGNAVAGELVLPEHPYDGDTEYTLIEIGSYAFRDCSALTSVTIPGSVTSIGSYAFRDCSALTSINISEGVTSIGKSAFNGCSGLTSVTIPGSVTSIGSSAFSGCSGLTSINISEGVTSIGESAFEDCSGLTSLSIPEGVTSIGSSAFYGCSALEKLYYNAKKCTAIGYWAFPTTISTLAIGDKVEIIPDYAFKNLSKITSVNIPASVTSIGYSAFYECSGLTSINIPEGVTSIGSYAFSGCSGLTSVVIPNLVTSVGRDAFKGCSGLIKSAYPSTIYDPFPNGVRINYPAGGAEIEDGYVWGPGKSAIYFVPLDAEGDYTIPASVTEIGWSAFRNCAGLTSVEIPEGVTSIGSSAFESCSGLTSVEIPEGVTSIGSSAFESCSGLTSVEIPEGVTSIGSSAFESCSGLTSINIPEAVTSIDGSAFEGCSALEKLYYNAKKCTAIGSSAFPTTISTLAIGDKVESIPNNAFKNLSKITSVNIPASVTSIGDFAFSGCSGLTSITIPEGVTLIGGSAFEGCSALENLYYNAKKCTAIYGAFPTTISTLAIGDKVEIIPNDAFKNLSKITSVNIPASVTSIGDRAFSSCSGLTSITIPEGVTSIGWNAFEGCSALEKLYYNAKKCTDIGSSAFPTTISTLEIGNKVERIPSHAFAGFNISSITIPASVTFIGGSAFSNCSALKELYFNAEKCTYCGSDIYRVFPSTISTLEIGDKVEIIPNYAFWNLSKITSVIIPNSVTSVGNEAFYKCSGLIKSAYPSTISNPFYNGIRIKYPAGGAEIEDGYVWGPEKSAIYFAPLDVEGDYTIPASVTEIGERAFSNCAGLTSVEIPEAVTSIGAYAFDGCNAIAAVSSAASTPPALEETSFANGTYASALLTIPDGSLGEYYATYWNKFASMLVDGAPGNVTAFNDDVFNYVYSPGSGEAILVKGNYSSLKNASIPNRIAIEDGDNSSFYKVTEIIDYAFNGCKSLTSVKLPKNLAKIGSGAFKGCIGITEIEFPENVKDIASEAFNGCTALASVTFTDGITDLAIGDGAFSGSGLTSIELPAGVKSVGAQAFTNCSALASVTFAEGISGVAIGDGAFSRSGLASIELPAGIKSVGTQAFNACKSLTSATFTNRIEEIPSGCFDWCYRLANVDLGNAVIAIGAEAFQNCNALHNITLPESLCSIGEAAFRLTGLSSIKIPDRVSEIGEQAFYSSSLMEATVPASVTTVGASAFGECRSMTAFTLADGLEPIELGSGIITGSAVETLHVGRDFASSSIVNEKISSLTVGNTVTAICDNAFNGCSKLTTVELGASLKSIGKKAFKGCALSEVAVPPLVETIGDEAFASNNLKTVSIGYSIKEIGEKAFDGSNAIENIHVTAVNPPTASNNTFSYYEAPLWLISKEAFDNYIDYPRCWYRFEDNMYTLVAINKMAAKKLAVSGLPGTTIKLEVEIEPANATLPQLFWRSTRPDLVSVDNFGNIYFNGEGNSPSRARSTDEPLECQIIVSTMYENAPELTFNVTVTDEEDGIEEVITDSPAAVVERPNDVYTIQGICIKRNATEDDVKSLAPGLYIIGGKKVVVK